MIITRFAPSPTGHLHVGNIRPALINWLFARKHNGKFILRIDDTDQTRCEQKYVDSILRDLEWLGLTWDEIYFQSKRMDMYETAKQELINNQRLYCCYETQEELEIKKKSLINRNLPPIYDRSALKLTQAEHQQKQGVGVHPHMRFFIADEPITWHDMVRGDIKFDSHVISDPILIRVDGTMTYMIATVVDDIDLKVSHIIRGEDHISNSAVHQQMFKALGSFAPEMGHLSLVKSKHGKVSKRDGGFEIHQLREAGIHPMSILSFFANIGSCQSIVPYSDINELINGFDISKYGKAPTTYDEEELKLLNAKLTHILSFKDAKPYLSNYIDSDFWESIKYNLNTISEAEDWYKIIYNEIPHMEDDAQFLKVAASLLPLEPWDDSTYNTWIQSIKDETGRNGKALFMPLRHALTAMEYGPELKKILPFIGYNKAVMRLSKTH